MPRKRAKAVASKKPMLPDGENGKNLSKAEKRAKLEVYLKDLDNKAENVRKKFETDLEKMNTMIERTYMMEITKLPLAIRGMKMKDFIAYGGTVEAAMEKLEKEKMEKSEVQYSATSVRTVSKTRILSDSRLLMQDTIPEEGSKTSNSVFSKKMKDFRTPMTQFKTPMHRPMQQLGWDTPMITPKFDPRLPVTPGVMRNANSKEVLVSLGGSPLRNPYTDFFKNEMFDVESEMEKMAAIPDTRNRITSMMEVLKEALEKADK